MNLIWVTQRVAYLPGKTNIGVILSRTPGKCILVDTGLDDNAGKRLLSSLAAHSLLPVAIINTHAHADHFGANAAIVAATGASVCAPAGEAEIIQAPDIEPMYLFSGARPIAELTGKFLRGSDCTVDRRLPNSPSALTIDETEIGTVPLPGHTPWQSGISCDGVLFCADSLFSLELLEKHKIPYFSDIGATRQTLTLLCDARKAFTFFVPCHAMPSHDVSDIARANLERLDEIQHTILQTTATGVTAQDLLKSLCGSLGLVIRSVQEYFLLNTVVLSFLSYLKDQGLISIEMTESMLRWHGVAGPKLNDRKSHGS